MAERKPTRGYITILDWMVNKLNLSGTKLLIYALIYGFSQDGTTWFIGSIPYIQSWTQSSKQTVVASLKNLREAGLIEVIDEPGKTNRYRARGLEEINSEEEADQSINLAGDQSKNLTGVVQKLDGGSLKIRPHTLYNNSFSNSSKNNIYIAVSRQVIDYLNQRLGTNYRATANDTYSKIHARVNEGYKVEDFKKVIDNKIADWYNDDKMRKYLRPLTLFGPNFESYLNELKPKDAQHGKWTSNEREYTAADLKEKIRDPLEDF